MNIQQGNHIAVVLGSHYTVYGSWTLNSEHTFMNILFLWHFYTCVNRKKKKIWNHSKIYTRFHCCKRLYTSHEKKKKFRSGSVTGAYICSTYTYALCYHNKNPTHFSKCETNYYSTIVWAQKRARRLRHNILHLRTLFN